MSSKQKLWEEAIVKYRLTENQVRMAQKLGLNPKKFPRYAGNKKLQPWKKPLGEFIKKIFIKRFPNSPEAKKAVAARRARKKKRKAARQAQKKAPAS